MRINLFPVQNRSISNNATVQELENMYLEANPDVTKSKVILRTRDGSAFASNQVATEIVNYEAANTGSLIGNGTILGLFVTPFDISPPSLAAGSNQLYDFFAGTSNTLLKNHTSPGGFSWTRTVSAGGEAQVGTGAYPSGWEPYQGALTTIGTPPKEVVYMWPELSFKSGNGVYFTIGDPSNINLANGVRMDYYPSFDQGLEVVTRFRDSGNLEMLTEFISTSNINSTYVQYKRYVNGSLANIQNTTTVVFNELGTGKGSKRHFTMTPSWTNYQLESNIGGSITNYYVNFKSAGTDQEWSNFGFSVINYAYSTGYSGKYTNYTCGVSTVNVVRPLYWFCDDLFISELTSASSNFTYGDPVKRFVVYESSNTSNITIGEILDGVVSKTVSVPKVTIHTTDSPIEYAAGFSNMIFTGDTANFVTYASTLDNPTVVAKPEFQDGDQGSLAYLGGYYYWNTEKTGRFYASALEDPTDWPILQYATAEYAGDSIQYLKAFKDYLWVFGGLTTEIWYQTGNTDFPLGRMPNGVLDIGLIEKAITQTLNSIYFVGTYRGTAGIYKTKGFEVEKISTPEIDRYIVNRFDANKNYNRSFFLSAYSQEDHFFVLFNRLGGDLGTPDYPSYDTTGKCYVYDEATGVWHKRSSSYGSGLSGAGYPFTWFINDDPSYKRKGKLGLAAGPATKGVTEIRLGLATDQCVDYVQPTNVATAYYDKVLVAPHISGEDRMVFFDRVRLDVANTYTNAPVMLRISDDDGDTWTNIGQAYMNDKYVEWWRLGRSEDRILRFESNANVLIYLTGGFVDARKGTHR